MSKIMFDILKLNDMTPFMNDIITVLTVVVYLNKLYS